MGEDPSFKSCGLGHHPSDLVAVENLPTFAPPGCAVEVGSFAGASSLRLVRANRHAGIRPLYCVDTWHGSPTDKSGRLARQHDVYAAFCENLGPYLGPECVPLVGTSLDWARRFATSGVRFSYVYVDAEHTEAAVTADLAAWAPLVVDGGILAGHDYDAEGFPGVKLAVDAFRAAFPGEWEWRGVSGSTVWVMCRRPSEA